MTYDHRREHLSGGPGNGQPGSPLVPSSTHGPSTADAASDVPGPVARSWLGLALAAFVIGAHLDGKDAGPLRNAVLVVTAPTALALLAAREQAARPNRLALAPAASTLGWAGLVLVAALGSAWSPYPSAAVRMVAYLLAWGGLFAAFRSFSMRGPRALPMVTALAAAFGLAIAVIQSAAFGNPFGASMVRFTSFASPQLFGLSLPILLALLLAAARAGHLGPTLVAPLCGALLVASQMNGGRIGCVASLLVLLVSIVPTAGLTPGRALRLPASVIAAAIVIATAIRVIAPVSLQNLVDANPVRTLLTFSERAMQESGDAGTMRDRVKIWKAISARQEHASTVAWMLGNGTAVSGAVIAEGDVDHCGLTAETMDANRTAHNEYLRALHEWGLAGLFALVALVSTPTLLVARRFLAAGRGEDLLVLAATAGGLVGYPLVENTLAAAGTPLGIAIVLLYVEACGAPSR